MQLNHQFNLKKFNSCKLTKHNLFLNQNKFSLPKALKYTYKFASIISPGSLKNMTLVSRSKPDLHSKNTICIKQSYILLTWMTYIRETQNKTKQNKTDPDEDTMVTTPSFFVHPPKKPRLTYLKAPMAHKTFSQEQFINKSYNLTISFNSTFKKHSKLNSINDSLYISLHLRSICLPTETNLLFLKKLRVCITSKDLAFMML